MTAGSSDSGGVLFLMRSPAYVRNFESVLRRLAERGHAVTVLFEERKKGGDEAGLAHVARLAEQYASFHYELLPPRPLGRRGRARMALAAGQDYLRYFDEPYGDARRLRSRPLEPLPAAVERALAATLRRSSRARRALAAAARRIEARLGYDSSVRRELARRRPRVLIVTPMVQLRSRQTDWVRAARDLGIRTMLGVYSWDNLTNKGLMHALPDRIVVWNEAQRRQAIELHGAAPESIVVAGAWPYDHWFGWRPSRSRAELCRLLGLPSEHAMFLYVCSSRFIAERERRAVARWVAALRSSEHPGIATANVVVRPHPLNAGEWADPLPEDLPGVEVFPAHGADPVDDSSRSDYFDSIANADAVVGINTSALIESAIIGRPAFALPGREFRSSQEELPHFRELAGERGIVNVAVSMAEHVAQLGEVLTDSAVETARRRRFVETFIRPRGGSPSPSERVVATVEELLDGMPAAADGEAESAVVGRRAPIALLLLLLTAGLVGCTSDSEDEKGPTTVEIVVTDEATGKPAAQDEADRASRIKSHIDTSDVVKLFPPTIVLDSDIEEHRKMTPGRALLEWWQAFQFRDVRTVKALTSRATLKAIGPRALADAVRRTGLQGIEVLDATTDGDTALIQTGLLNFSAQRGEPPPRTPTGSQPATFAMTREAGNWVFDQTDFLSLKVNNLQK
jgi:hypothetical protein